MSRISTPILIAIDLDGTLLTTDKTILPSASSAIACAAAAGAAVALCTGRCLPQLETYLPLLPLVRYLILSSGAMILDREAAVPVFSSSFSESDALEILSVSADFDCLTVLHTASAVFYSRPLSRVGEYGIAFHPSFVNAQSRFIANPLSASAGLQGLLKINLYFRTQADRRQAEHSLSALPFQTAYGLGTSLEISPSDATKGTALVRLASALHIPPLRTAVIGDSDNDLSAMQAAGLAIAMGNAAPSVKMPADHIVSDNDHSGIQEAVNYIFKSLLPASGIM